MFEAREECQTAKEDMFVCYLIGYFHAVAILDKPNVTIIHL